MKTYYKIILESLSKSLSSKRLNQEQNNDFMKVAEELLKKEAANFNGTYHKIWTDKEKKALEKNEAAITKIFRATNPIDEFAAYCIDASEKDYNDFLDKIVGKIIRKVSRRQNLSGNALSELRETLKTKARDEIELDDNWGNLAKDVNIVAAFYSKYPVEIDKAETHNPLINLLSSQGYSFKEFRNLYQNPTEKKNASRFLKSLIDEIEFQGNVSHLVFAGKISLYEALDFAEDKRNVAISNRTKLIGLANPYNGTCGHLEIRLERPFELEISKYRFVVEAIDAKKNSEGARAIQNSIEFRGVVPPLKFD